MSNVNVSSDRGICYTGPYLITDENVMTAFRQAVEVQSLIELNDIRKKGVYFFRSDEISMVKIIGGCPNRENGECRLGENCVGAGRERR